jgi:caa(3)-type oxidase subunit IV
MIMRTGAPLVLALVALLALTALTFGLHFAGIPDPWSIIVALAIAAAKIAIVAMVFMELREVRGSVAIVAAVTISFVALLCAGIAGDVAFR